MSQSAEVQITLPDGTRSTYEKGTTFLTIAGKIGARLAKAALAVKANGKVLDVFREVQEDTDLQILTAKSPEGLDVIRHSTAHVLAMAVQKLWPGTQVTIGPVIENGFFYDFAFPESVKLSEADLPKIEQAMHDIVKADHQVSREVVTRLAAIETFKKLGELFKVQIVEGIPAGEEVTIYKMGNWFDLCTGPHVPRTSLLGAFKLTSVAGSYWRGDERNPRLTRIYGTAWADKKDLEDYLHRIEEAKKRDHRLLGKQLDLFSFHVEAPAAPFFHPKGQLLYSLLVDYTRRANRKWAFQEVGTPLIMDMVMWKKSGHYDNYAENMYRTMVDETESAVKPMNCPGHCLIFGTTRRSYRELPLRLSEFGRVHRHERSGVTHGLMRVRTFVQDDSHTFCTVDQIITEVGRSLSQIDEMYKGLGFKEYRLAVATRPEKSIGSDAMWAQAEAALHDSMKAAGKEYKVLPGEGAFYGPKIEFHLIDSLGRSWQCGTIQLDFSMPDRFGLNYVGNDDKPHTPVMIHRASLGSLERFLGIFLEHYAGHFPLWASPTQAIVISVNEAQREYAEQVTKELKDAGVRVEIDARNEKLGFKIREAQLQKIPYMLVLGEREVTSGTVSPRFHDGKNLEPMAVPAFVEHIKSECGDEWGLGM